MFAREKQCALYGFRNRINVRICHEHVMVRIRTLCKYVFFPSRYVSRFWEGDVLKVQLQMVQDRIYNFFVGFVT
jgi:hypothetical protein